MENICGEEEIQGGIRVIEIMEDRVGLPGEFDKLTVRSSHLVVLHILIGGNEALFGFVLVCALRLETSFL